MCSDKTPPDITPRKEIYVMNASDVKLNKRGEIEIKRKYGKFKRPVVLIGSNSN